jgi:hypothetical protein
MVLNDVVPKEREEVVRLVDGELVDAFGEAAGRRRVSFRNRKR